MPPAPQNIPTLLVNQNIYSGWTQFTISRGLKNAAARFDIGVTERWATGAAAAPPWQIGPFDPVVVKIDNDVVMTGYVDAYQPNYGAETHGVRIAGRSKTADVIDCMPEIVGGQFNGYTLDAIARALCAPLGVGVVVAAPMGAAFPDASMQRGDTAFAMIERLARQRELLVFDDVNGNLVLGTLGTQVAAGALIEGQNIVEASGSLLAQRYSIYTIRSQTGMTTGDEDVDPDVLGQATDPGVPRYRPWTKIAESALTAAQAQKRADWQYRQRLAACVQAQVKVKGWRQPDNSLWQVNQLVTVTSPRLAINRQMLVGALTFSLTEHGRFTELTLEPPEAFSPEPPKPVKGKGNNDVWAGLKPVQNLAAGKAPV